MAWCATSPTCFLPYHPRYIYSHVNFTYVLNIVARSEMLMKSICKNMQNHKIYTSYTYFHTFQPQNKNGLVNQESVNCPGFENKICRCSKKMRSRNALWPPQMLLHRTETLVTWPSQPSIYCEHISASYSQWLWLKFREDLQNCRTNISHVLIFLLVQ